MRPFGLCFFMLFGAMSCLYAQEIPNDARLAAQGWRILAFDAKKPNSFTLKPDTSIEIKSDQSVSLLYKNMAVDLEKTPKLAWDWQVEKSVPVTDLTIKGSDDRALALYVSFPFDVERASFWEKFIRALVVAFKGEDTPGRVISYVWGGDVKRGAVLESPYLKEAGAMVILQSAHSHGPDWQSESVDIAKDYERIFGIPANNPFQIAISADTDDTKVQSLGWIKNIRFE
jgi:hypothetical protein